MIKEIKQKLTTIAVISAIVVYVFFILQFSFNNINSIFVDFSDIERPEGLYVRVIEESISRESISFVIINNTEIVYLFPHSYSDFISFYVNVGSVWIKLVDEYLLFFERFSDDFFYFNAHRGVEWVEEIVEDYFSRFYMRWFPPLIRANSYLQHTTFLGRRDVWLPLLEGYTGAFLHSGEFKIVVRMGRLGPPYIMVYDTFYLR